MVSADNIWEDMKKEMITGGNYERKKVKDNWKMKRTVNAKRVRDKGKNVIVELISGYRESGRKINHS